MTLRKALVLVAVACLLAVSASAQTPSPQAGVGGSADFANEGPIVLYDQTDDPAGNGIPDQDFEAGFDAYDAEGADDFDVDFPDGWNIDQVNTVGTTGTPGGALVDVNIYTDNGGTPLGGTIICSYDDVPPTLDNLGSLTVDLPATCVAAAGLHWVAIQVNQNFGTFGQHFWSNRNTQTNGPAHWRNPGGGFGLGCADWTPATVCTVGGGVAPDQLFSIAGTLGEPMDPTIDVPTLGQFGLVALLLSLLGAGIFRLRRRES